MEAASCLRRRRELCSSAETREELKRTCNVVEAVWLSPEVVDLRCSKVRGGPGGEELKLWLGLSG